MSRTARTPARSAPDTDTAQFDAQAPQSEPEPTATADGLAVDATDAQGTEVEPESPNAEAARYRRRLRDAEAERDRLAGQLTSYQRSEVERLAAEAGMVEPTDLWTVGAELEWMLRDDGTIDTDAVATAVDAVLAERPHWRTPFPDLGQGARGPASAPMSWSVALSASGR